MSLRGSRKLVFWLLATCLVGVGGPQGFAASADGTEERTAERNPEEISDGVSARVLARVRAYLGEQGISVPGLTSGQVQTQVQTQVQAEDLVVASPPPSGAEVLATGGRWAALRR